MLQTHFGELKAKALTAKSKSGHASTYLAPPVNFVFDHSQTHWDSFVFCTLLFLLFLQIGFKSDNTEEKIFSKKPAAKKKPTAAASKKAPDDDEDVMFVKVPFAASTSRTKMTPPSNDYNIWLLDTGHCFLYTKDREHKVKVNIHILGVVTTGSFQTQGIYWSTMNLMRCLNFWWNVYCSGLATISMFQALISPKFHFFDTLRMHCSSVGLFL